MDRGQWIDRIKAACAEAGTYRPYFDDAIDTLAGILERRDIAEAMFRSSGGNILIKHTNKAGATNIEQNPALRMINDLNRDALQYWRDLGLTPVGLRKINEAAMKAKKRSALAEALKGIG